ncbi:MAG: hypothetical protein ACRD1X_03260 [Vicinamibacteria bacterium]
MEEGLQRLVESVDFSLLDAPLAEDVEASLGRSLAEGVVFSGEESPLAIFRAAVASAIQDIEGHPRGQLLQRFLTIGPYWDGGEIPADKTSECFSDDETAAATAFVYYYMVNAFQGRLAEMLALAPCLKILKRLVARGTLPPSSRLYAGDTVMLGLPDRSGWVKGADLHLLVEGPRPSKGSSFSVAGVVEVKSYSSPPAALRRQLDRHIAGVRHGLRVGDLTYPAESIRVGAGARDTVVRISVVPSRWRLPRTFRFVDSDRGHVLRIDPAVPPTDADHVVPVGPEEWRITLRWSKEALAAAAYELTFWYMAKVGEVVYATGVPKDWSAMTPAEAGRNAAKMMLYYAILRTRSWYEEQRAIALYNAYGFGYALGTSFKNERGSREMLWPEDLREILEHGKTKHGCRLVP